MEEKLEFIFKNVNNWLKFAEAKNAALLAFNLGIIFGTLRLYSNFTHVENDLCWLEYYGILALSLLSVSAIICLLSYVPRMEIPWLKQKEGIELHTKNVLFFGDIALFSPQNYITELAKINGVSAPESGMYLENIASQIIVNSRIAVTKYKMFGYGIWITITAISTPIIALILFLFLASRK